MVTNSPTTTPRTPLSPEDSTLFSLFASLHFSLPDLAAQTTLPLDHLADWADRPDIRERTDTLLRLSLTHLNARDAVECADLRINALRGLDSLNHADAPKEDIRRSSTTILRYTHPVLTIPTRAPSPRDFAGSTRPFQDSTTPTPAQRAEDRAQQRRAQGLEQRNQHHKAPGQSPACSLRTTTTIPDSALRTQDSGLSTQYSSLPPSPLESPMPPRLARNVDLAALSIQSIFLSNSPNDAASLDHSLRSLHFRCVPASRINTLPVPTDPSAFISNAPAPLLKLLSKPITDKALIRHAHIDNDPKRVSSTLLFTHPDSTTTSITFTQLQHPDTRWRMESLDIHPTAPPPDATPPDSDFAQPTLSAA